MISSLLYIHPFPPVLLLTHTRSLSLSLFLCSTGLATVYPLLQFPPKILLLVAEAAADAEAIGGVGHWGVGQVVKRETKNRDHINFLLQRRGRSEL